MSFKLLLTAALAAGLNMQASVVFDSYTGVQDTSSRKVGDKPVELGDLITFAGTERDISTVSVLFKQGLYPGQTSFPYETEFTLSLYSSEKADSKLTSQTVSQQIAGPGVFTVEFNFNGFTVPGSLYYGISIDTEGDGPFDALTLVVWNENLNGPVPVGTNPENVMFSRQKNTTDSFAPEGNGDGMKDGYTGAIQFNTLPGFPVGDDVSGVPEPGTFALMGFGLIGIAVYSRRK